MIQMKHIDFNDPPRSHFVREPARLAVREGFVSCSCSQLYDHDICSYFPHSNEEDMNDLQLLSDQLKAKIDNRPFASGLEPRNPPTQDRLFVDKDDYFAIMNAVADNEAASSSVQTEMKALIEFCRQEDEVPPYLEDERISYEFGCKVADHCGDVKRQIWQSMSSFEVNKLPTETFTPASCCSSTVLTEEFCPICQCDFDYDETLRRLPCGHRFHVECVDRWLQESSSCPSCQTSIMKE